MGQMIRWTAPSSEFTYTHTRVYRSNDGSSYSELTSSDVSGYTASGIPIAQLYAHDRGGVTGNYYKLRFFDSVNSTYSEYTDAMRASDYRGYCTVEDVRSFSNIDTTEYDDGAIQIMIDSVTAEIDKKTNRTWQGVQTVTDEYLDCDGGQELFLPHGDIVAVTALSIDSSMTNSYVVVSVSNVLVYSGQGKIVLDKRKSGLEVSSFPIDGYKAAKISYTYGNADPDSDVRYLAIMMVLNQIHLDPIRYNKVQATIRRLTRKSFKTL